jgi:hypothetical protein
MGPSMSVCLYHLLQQCEPKSLLDYIVTLLTWDKIIETMTFDIIVAFDTTVAFVIPLVALLTSLPVMWREERLRISVYSKECIFPIVFIWIIIHSEDKYFFTSCAYY